MKKIVLFLVLVLFQTSVFAAQTEASKYTEEQYSKQTGNERVRINVKKEHTEEHQQMIGGTEISAITYGYGYMKAEKCRKKRISYVCLLDKNCKPVWSYVVKFK